MRRLYQVLRNNVAAMVVWLVVLLGCSFIEREAIKTDFWHTYFFLTAQLPLYFIVLFGCYALCSIGYYLFVLEDCTKAHAELTEEIKVARADLIRRGVKLMQAISRRLGYGKYITPAGITALQNHQYKAGQYTPLDNAMQPFWNWFVTLFPLWVAPNILTLAALGISFAACCQYLPFDGTISAEFPAWTYYFSAFALIMYQTLDAVDGKQARRTGSSSPLGQLFDHGCDAINTNFFGFLFYQSYQLGASWHTIIVCGASTLTFYGAQWEEHETHTLRTAMGWFGVTELQWVLALSILANTLSGQFICKGTLGETPYLNEIVPDFAQDYSYLDFIVIGNFIPAVGQFSVSIYNALTMTQQRPRSKILLGLIPIVLYAGIFIVMYTCTEWAWSFPGYVFMMVTPVISLINQRQIVCNFTGMNMHNFPRVTLWYLLFPANKYLPALGSPSYALTSTGEQLLIQESYVAWIIFAITTLWYLFFAVGTVDQICQALDIDCFRIKKKNIEVITMEDSTGTIQTGPDLEGKDCQLMEID